MKFRKMRILRNKETIPLLTQWDIEPIGIIVKVV